MAELKKSLYIAFDKQLIEFNDQLINRFPNDNQDFKVFKNGVRLLKNTSSDGTIHRLFKKHIEEYRNNIETRNEQFFMENDFKNVINKAKDNSGDINQIITKLKILWKDLDQPEKDKIWDYFNLLLKLSDKISSL